MKGKEANNDSIFERKEMLLDIWKKTTDTIDSQGELIWGSVRYFFLLATALISAYLVALGVVLELEEVQMQLFVSSGLFILPLLVVAFSCVGMSVARRRFSRILENIAHKSKIESLLGLDEDISDRLRKLDMFPEDSYLFQRFVHSKRKYRSEDEFIQGELNEPLAGKTTYTDIKNAYWGLIVIGIFLIFLNYFLLIYFFRMYASTL